jgi:transcriptional regulator with XRE-family HTH domain
MDAPPTDTPDLALKIKRLVKERGWNQEEFARISRLNRHTVRQIMAPGDGPQRRMRNSTVGACARALGLTVSELTDLPLERLLPRMVEGGGPDESLRRRYEEATQPELRAWMERNPDRARQLSDDELDEILAMQGPGGPLAAFGVEAFVARIERRRELLRQVGVVAGTEYLELLEQLVRLLYDKVRPPGNGAGPA